MSSIAPFLLVCLWVVPALAGVQVKGGVGAKLEEPTQLNENETPGSMPTMSNASVIANQYYAHGAFMASAPELWNDRRWNEILQNLMPEVYADVAEQVASGGDTLTPRVIQMFENNPVMAAYGLLATKAIAEVDKLPSRLSKMRGFEWDCFVDPVLVQSWKNAGVASDAKDAVADKIADTMLIAHGSGLTYAIGLWDEYQKVLHTRKTALGGAVAIDWMNLFSNALVLGGNDTLPVKDKREWYSFQEGVALYRQTVGEAVFQEAPFSVILDMKTVDKSGSFLPALLDDVILSLNRRGIRVEGIGTFLFESFPKLQAGNLSSEQVLHVGSELITTAPVTRVKFAHYVGGFQNHMLEGRVATGDTVLFNACSLFESHDVFRNCVFCKASCVVLCLVSCCLVCLVCRVPSRVCRVLCFLVWVLCLVSCVTTCGSCVTGQDSVENYALNERILGSLAVYQRRLDLALGVYVQDNDIDVTAYDLLVGAVNDYPDIFRKGFAWGAVNGRISGAIKRTRGAPRFGCSIQQWVGISWDLDLADDLPLLYAWLAVNSTMVEALKEALELTTKKPSIKGFDNTGENWHIHGDMLGRYPNIDVQARMTKKGVEFTAMVRKGVGKGQRAYVDTIALSAIPLGPLAPMR